MLREEGVVRIYDIFFDYDVLLSTDAFFRQIMRAPEFQRAMSSAEFHALCGKYVREREKALGIGQRSLLSAAYTAGVPIYTSSPGDSSIGMNIAALALEGSELAPRSESGCERDGVDRARRQARRAGAAPS